MKTSEKRSLSDSWQTPMWLFNKLNEEHGPFDIDLCANKENSKCLSFYVDYLNNQIGHKVADYVRNVGLNDIEEEDFVCFMNPPYSNPLPFVEKAWEDSKHCKIVLLLKVDTSTKWWSVFWNYEDTLFCGQCGSNELLGTHLKYYRCLKCDSTNKWEQCRRVKSGPKSGCEVQFLPKRVAFTSPQELIDSGVVYKINNKWVQKCTETMCWGKGYDSWLEDDNVKYSSCTKCKGKGYTTLAGPTFPSCVVIFDRRNVRCFVEIKKAVSVTDVMHVFTVI